MDKSRKIKICASCSKELINGTKLATIKVCGHVYCHVCLKKFILSACQCTVCSKKFKKRDLVDLSSEGTSFSALGRAEAKKYDYAFQ
jgi:hypothetical protein